MLKSIFFLFIVQAVWAQDFSSMGKYDGQRLGSNKDGEETEELAPTTFLVTQKHEGTADKFINLYIAFTPFDEDEGRRMRRKRHTNAFLFSFYISLDNYLELFESEEEIEDMPLDREFVDKHRTIVASATGGVSNRVVSITFNDRSPNQVQHATYHLKDNRFVKYSMRKEAETSFFFASWWDEYINTESTELTKVRDGLHLRPHYNAVTEEEDIRSATNDPSVLNFQRLARKYKKNEGV